MKKSTEAFSGVSGTAVNSNPMASANGTIYNF